jgi:hypothetical protein
VNVAEVTRKIGRAHLKHAYLLGLLSLAYVAWVAPVALQSMALVASKVWGGACMGYWVDRAIFDYARPGDDELHDAWMYRRAFLVGCCVLGLSLGV